MTCTSGIKRQLDHPAHHTATKRPTKRPAVQVSPTDVAQSLSYRGGSGQIGEGEAHGPGPKNASGQRHSRPACPRAAWPSKDDRSRLSVGGERGWAGKDRGIERGWVSVAHRFLRLARPTGTSHGAPSFQLMNQSLRSRADGEWRKGRRGRLLGRSLLLSVFARVVVEGICAVLSTSWCRKVPQGWVLSMRLLL